LCYLSYDLQECLAVIIVLLCHIWHSEQILNLCVGQV